MATFKRGTLVTIYGRPLTGEQCEGKARLIRCLRPAEPGRSLERWLVGFVNEPGARYEREISTDLCIEGHHPIN